MQTPEVVVVVGGGGGSPLLRISRDTNVSKSQTEIDSIAITRCDFS